MNISEPSRFSPGVVVCTLSGVDFAVSLESTRTAITLPDPLVEVPRRHGAVSGLVTYAGRSIPLLDLRLWLQWPDRKGASDEKDDLALVLASEGRQVAIRVGALRNVYRDTAKMSRICHQAENIEDVFNFALTLPATNGESVGVLDVERLLQLCATWSEVGPDAGPIDPQANPDGNCGAKTLEQLAIIHCDRMTFGIGAQDVIAVTRMPSISLIPLQTSLLGYVTWRGRQVPVLPLTLLGAVNDGAHHPYLAIVGTPDSWIGVPASGIGGVQRVDLEHFQSPSEAGFSNSPTLRGVISLQPFGSVALLETAVLVTHCPIGSVNSAEVGHALLTKATLSGKGYMIVKGRREWALPMEHIDQVVPLPVGLEWTTRHSEGRESDALAHMSHKGKTIPVWESEPPGTTSFEQKKTSPRSVVIFVRAGIFFGVVFDALRHILPPTACEIAHIQGERNTRQPIVITGSGHAYQHKTYPIWDLSRDLETSAEADPTGSLQSLA